MAQWTAVQAEVATIAHPKIGSICSVSEDGQPVIGRLSTALAEGLPVTGPFSSAAEHFTAVGEAAISRLSLLAGDPKGDFKSLPHLGALVFLDILKNTPLFTDDHPGVQFPLNHMDLGTQNILVDGAFNFLAIIDWEFAQTAPWQANHYPMPFPLLWSDQKISDVLADSDHIAHGNVSRQAAARRLYAQKFREAGEKLREEGRGLGRSVANVLDSEASRVYGCFTRLRGVPEQDEGLARDGKACVWV
jgi:hypothetical protein